MNSVSADQFVTECSAAHQTPRPELAAQTLDARLDRAALRAQDLGDACRRSGLRIDRRRDAATFPRPSGCEPSCACRRTTLSSSRLRVQPSKEKCRSESAGELRAEEGNHIGDANSGEGARECACERHRGIRERCRRGEPIRRRDVRGDDDRHDVRPFARCRARPRRARTSQRLHSTPAQLRTGRAWISEGRRGRTSNGWRRRRRFRR